jgi:resuscitation-promoting factor RpfB
MRLFTDRKLWVAVFLAVAALISLVTAAYLAAEPSFTIYDGNVPQVVSGRYETVGDLLQAASISLREQDIVTPGMSETAVSSIPIQIQRAQPVTIQTEDGTKTYWTVQPTLSAFLFEIGTMPRRTDQVVADGQLLTFTDLGDALLPRKLEIGRFLTITIQDGNRQQLIRTAVQTVGDALQEAGITIFAADGVEPSLGSWLEPDMVIQVVRSFPITIAVDGRFIQTRSHHTNSMHVLAEAGIGLIGFDYAKPGQDTILRPNDTIEVIRVTEDFQLVDTPLPYQTVWQASDELDLDSRAVISYGAAGILRQRMRVRYENGIEVSQAVDGEWVAQEPVNEVIGYGTRINIGVVNTLEGPREYWRVVRMRVTSYTAASSGKSPGDPGYGITASGLPAGTGIVAIDRNVVPFRSELFIPGYGIGFAGDTGGGVRGRWIDLGYDENEYESWSGYVDVYYLTPVPDAANINYILPDGLP